MDRTMVNLASLALSGTYDHDKPILVDADNPERSVSLKHARRLVAQLSKAFKPDSTVCLHLTNDVLYPVLVLAILASGCRWTGTNPAYTAPEIAHHLRLSGATYIVVSPEHDKTVSEALAGQENIVEMIIFQDILGVEIQSDCGGDLPAGKKCGLDTESEKKGRTLSDCLELTCSETSLHRDQKICAGPIAVLMQTSGTTGLPKVAARTHQAMIAEVLATADNHEEKRYEVRRLCCTPMFHGFTFPEVAVNALRLGITTYVMKRFDKTFAQKVHQYRITETFAAPPMLLMLVKDPDSHKKIQSLRTIYFGGAPLVPELRASTLRMFHEAPHIVPVYGMTEGGWFTTFKYPEVHERHSLGYPLPGLEMKVSLSETTVLDNGIEAGELLVKGAQLMSGYLDNERASLDAFEDGWLKTGDLGYIQDNQVFIVGRLKELIKTNAWAVAPAELENALMEAAFVLDAAAFAVGHGVEEHPMLCVVRAHQDVTETQLMTHLLSRLARYKVNRCEIRFVDFIPKSAAGKILRKQLKAMIEAE